MGRRYLDGQPTIELVMSEALFRGAPVGDWWVPRTGVLLAWPNTGAELEKAQTARNQDRQDQHPDDIIEAKPDHHTFNVVRVVLPKLMVEAAADHFSVLVEDLEKIRCYDIIELALPEDVVAEIDRALPAYGPAHARARAGEFARLKRAAVAHNRSVLPEVEVVSCEYVPPRRWSALRKGR